MEQDLHALIVLSLDLQETDHTNQVADLRVQEVVLQEQDHQVLHQEEAENVKLPYKYRERIPLSRVLST